tara:strand:- start:219 stop:518 length:300 start_codon:yes stop_codon:yes gene_type:complete
MWPRTEKSEEKKTIILGWYWLTDLFAYIYNALVDGISSLLPTPPSTSTPSASAEDCYHPIGKIEQGELYYGLGENQYTTYWYCEDCGEEIPDDYGVDRW